MTAIDILKEALKVFGKNPSFILFAALLSLPLFLFSLHFQSLIHGFVFEASQSLTPRTETLEDPDQSMYEIIVVKVTDVDLSVPIDLVRNLSKDQFRKLLHLGFLYLAPFNLLQLATAILVVDVASKLHREGKALTLRDMLGTRVDGERLRGVLATFVYVAAFSVSTVTGFAWLALTYTAVLEQGISSGFYKRRLYQNYINPLTGDLWFHIQYGTNLVLLMGIFLGWGSIWNLGLVVSILEGRFGTRALGCSGFLCLRNIRTGMVLTLVFSLFEMGFFWVPSLLCFGGYETWVVIVAQCSLFCFGNSIKWVGFVVYFDYCVKKLFVKRNDIVEEQA